MKSILVDALRQANGDEPDSTLSDSGSFDSTETDFGPTANDEEVVPLENPDQNLELLQTAAFQKEDFDSELDTEFPEQSMAITRVMVSAASMPTHGSARAPALARCAPLICVAVALVSAASWAAYQQYGTNNHDNRLSGADMQARSGIDRNDILSTVRTADRFPFIDAAVEPDGATESE